MGIYVISGHYGSGKTNISINLAYKLLKQGSVAIFDLDVVNPYFRTADFTEKMRGDGITVVAPVFANTNLNSAISTPESTTTSSWTSAETIPEPSPWGNTPKE